jgi:hypothetical protein
MAEYERAGPNESWRYNPAASGRTIDPLFPEAISQPKTDEPRPPANDVNPLELFSILAVVGGLLLATVLFFIVMVVLQATVFAG